MVTATETPAPPEPRLDPNVLEALRSRYGTLGIVGGLAELEARDAALHRKRLEWHPAEVCELLAKALREFERQAQQHLPGTRAVQRRFDDQNRSEWAGRFRTRTR